MRKLGIFALWVSLLITLVACSFPFTSDSSGDQHIENVGSDNVTACVKNFGLYSLKDYQQYFSTLDVVPDIVLYEDISQFGEFVGYVDVFGYFAPSCKEYLYTLCDSRGYTLHLRVEHIENATLDAQNAKFEKGKIETSGDLRKLSDGRSAILELDGFQYRYLKWGLYEVSWYENGIRFSLTGGGLLCNYPTESDTLVGKLLDSETARDAIKTIKAMNITEGLPRGTADANITPAS